jgi:putative DNA primase/helicase
MTYGKRRKDAAKQIGIPVSILDQLVAALRPPPTPTADDIAEKFGWAVEPWDEPVDLATLLSDLARFFARHVVLPKGAATAMALWIVHAWMHESAEISPLLTFTSPDMRCGKSTALTAVMALLPRALPASNISPAAIFRSIEAWQPSLAIDEADSFMGESEEEGCRQFRPWPRHRFRHPGCGDRW